jgi:hypothetical protein
MIASITQTACDSEYESGNRFLYELQGTWRTNGYNSSKYYGSLEIDYNYITINGYGETQTAIGDDENQRPFKDYIKELPIKGYSIEETKTSDRIEGQLFIQDGGVFTEEGIPYVYWTTTANSPEYQRIHFLRFSFGGRIETLVKEQTE